MRKKEKERELARELRLQGKSIDQIAAKIGVAHSSVSIWVRDIKLTEEHKKILAYRSTKHLLGGRKKGVKTRKRVEMGEEAWKIYQEDRKKKSVLTYRNKYTSEWWSQKRRDLKKKLVEYKGGKCIICGYSKCLPALEFHHKDPSEKEYALSNSNSTNFEKLKREADKCDLLCNRCHVELHEDIGISKNK